MINIDLLTQLTNMHLAQSDVVEKRQAKETALITINECKTMLDELKTVLKENEKEISVANYLSMCLAISQQITEIKQTVCYLKTRTPH